MTDFAAPRLESIRDQMVIEDRERKAMIQMAERVGLHVWRHEGWQGDSELQLMTPVADFTHTGFDLDRERITRVLWVPLSRFESVRVNLALLLSAHREGKTLTFSERLYDTVNCCGLGLFQVRRESTDFRTTD